MTVYRVKSYLGSEPRKIWCFAGEEVNIDYSHTKPDQPQDCPKDQGKELVESNLAPEGEELKPTFFESDLPV